jgi:Insecticide toxin TcdB middle/N-terminal region.
MGSGRNDLIMIGPRSVRLYANQKITGFAPATQVSRHADEDDLPQPGNSPSELVAFSDLLGSGQQHLIRVRHNEVKCWPNLGRGRFAKGRVIASLDLAYEQFDASRILLADLDGSGAADLIYLQPDCAKIFMNRGGNGLAPAVELPWPQGLRHDRFCKVSAVDLLGLGCSSLIFSVPGDATRHWRYDFVETKPYLLETSNNNMGLPAASAIEALPRNGWMKKNSCSKTTNQQSPTFHFLCFWSNSRASTTKLPAIV